ncbi:hypothetical protein HDE_00999 [Halotydeus destructor]|nr:hypothetical protein HDE_00999 [Halotydeus destructor]
MRRSKAPSAVLNRNPLANCINVVGLTSKRKCAYEATGAIKKLNSEGDSESASETESSQEVKEDKYAGLSHEDRIQAILKKPYVCPIPGYKTSGRALGFRRSANTALHDPKRKERWFCMCHLR